MHNAHIEYKINSIMIFEYHL